MWLFSWVDWVVLRWVGLDWALVFAWLGWTVLLGFVVLLQSVTPTWLLKLLLHLPLLSLHLLVICSEWAVPCVFWLSFCFFPIVSFECFLQCENCFANTWWSHRRCAEWAVPSVIALCGVRFDDGEEDSFFARLLYCGVSFGPMTWVKAITKYKKCDHRSHDTWCICLHRSC